MAVVEHSTAHRVPVSHEVWRRSAPTTTTTTTTTMGGAIVRLDGALNRNPASCCFLGRGCDCRRTEERGRWEEEEEDVVFDRPGRTNASIQQSYIFTMSRMGRKEEKKKRRKKSVWELGSVVCALEAHTFSALFPRRASERREEERSRAEGRQGAQSRPYPSSMSYLLFRLQCLGARQASKKDPGEAARRRRRRRRRPVPTLVRQNATRAEISWLLASAQRGNIDAAVSSRTSECITQQRPL